jgi:hypothetical protein
LKAPKLKITRAERRNLIFLRMRTQGEKKEVLLEFERERMFNGELKRNVWWK